MKRLGIAVLVLVLASLMAVYAYGRFAERARGEPGAALPAIDDGVPLDRWVAGRTDAHPGQTGMQVLGDNIDAFAMRALSARAAGRSLDLQYYIWHPDLTGSLLQAELLRAADRGVRVRLLLDDMNVRDGAEALAALDSHPSIEVRLFNPTRARDGSLWRGMEMLLRFVSINRRMHNKAWIVDNRMAIVGGRNIGDEYFDASGEVNFRDTDVVVLGSAVGQASDIFDAYWNSPSAIPLRALQQAEDGQLDALRATAGRPLDSVAAKAYMRRIRESESVQSLMQGGGPMHWSADARVVSDPPEKAEGASMSADWLTPQLIEEMNRARHELKLISPYFVPGDAGVDWIAGLRRRGVEVGILTNSLAANDVVAVHGGYAGYRLPLLREGVSLFELMPHGKSKSSWFGSSGASLHTKAFVLDDDGGFIGSFNLDPRSANLNTEMGLLFRHPAMAEELESIYAEKTSASDSYALYLEDGQLRWRDGSTDPATIWTHEPEASTWRRMVARVIGWLPVESQL